LVEDDGESEGTVRRIFPDAQATGDGILVGRREALPDCGIERLVRLEPALSAGSEPEREGVLGGLPRRQGLFVYGSPPFGISRNAAG
jgi:hypothetical protein